MDVSLTTRGEKVTWGIAGVVITAVAAFVLYSFFGALVVGLFLYYATRPIYRWLDGRTGHPDLNATVTILVVGLPILLVLGYGALVGVRELDQFLRIANLEQFRSAIRPYVDIVAAEDQSIAGFLRNNASRIGALATTAFTWSLRLFVIVTFAFYLLRDDRKLARWFRRSLGEDHSAVAFMEEADAELTTIYTGNLITIGVTALIAAAVFYALDLLAPNATGVQFPVLLGLLTGIATLIPAVGMKLIYVPYTGYLLWQAQSSADAPLWFPVVFFLVTLVVVDSVPDLFIRSYLSKGELNMGLMLLTYVLGAVAFGWYGVFFGPVVLVFFVTFAREIFPSLLGRRAAAD